MHENCVQFPQGSHSTINCVSLLCLETSTSTSLQRHHMRLQTNIPLKFSKSLATA